MQRFGLKKTVNPSSAEAIIKLSQFLHCFIADPILAKKEQLQSLLADKSFQAQIKNLMNDDGYNSLPFLIVLAEMAVNNPTQLDAIKTELHNYLLYISKIRVDSSFPKNMKKQSMIFFELYYAFLFKHFVENKNGMHLAVVDQADTDSSKVPRGLLGIVKPLAVLSQKLSEKYEIKFDCVATVGTLQFSSIHKKQLYIQRMDSRFPYAKYHGSGVGTLLMNRACELAIQHRLPLELMAEQIREGNDALPFYVKFFKKRFNLLEIQARNQINNGSMYVGGGERWAPVNVSVAQLDGQWDRSKPAISDDYIISFLCRGTLKKVNGEIQGIVFKSSDQLKEAIQLLNIGLGYDPCPMPTEEKANIEKSNVLSRDLFSYRKSDTNSIELTHPELIKALRIRKAREFLPAPPSMYSSSSAPLPAVPKPLEENLFEILQALGTLQEFEDRPGKQYIKFASKAERDGVARLLETHASNPVFNFRRAGKETCIEIMSPTLVRFMSVELETTITPQSLSKITLSNFKLSLWNSKNLLYILNEAPSAVSPGIYHHTM